MSKAFLALWNDYPATLTEEYETWHSFEHVPERLTAPGLLAARRYGSFGEDANRYFTLYDLENLAALESPAYLDLVQRPTDWSARMRRHFLNVLRIPAETILQAGHGRGSHLLAQAWSVDRRTAPSMAVALGKTLQDCVSQGRLLSLRIGLAEPNQPYEVFEQADTTDPDTLNVVVIAEGISRPMLEKARKPLIQAATELLSPRSLIRDGIFELLADYRAEDMPRERHALAAPESLRRRFAAQHIKSERIDV